MNAKIGFNDVLAYVTDRITDPGWARTVEEALLVDPDVQQWFRMLADDDEEEAEANPLADQPIAVIRELTRAQNPNQLGSRSLNFAAVFAPDEPYRAITMCPENTLIATKNGFEARYDAAQFEYGVAILWAKLPSGEMHHRLAPLDFHANQWWMKVSFASFLPSGVTFNSIHQDDYGLLTVTAADQRTLRLVNVEELEKFAGRLDDGEQRKRVGKLIDLLKEANDV